MKKLMSIAFLLVSVFGFGQKAETATTCPCPQRNSITVRGEGVFETDPDVAVVSLTISTQEKQLKDAYARATHAADQIREAMRANGIDPKDAQIGFFQVAPVYDYGKKRKAVGYAVKSQMKLKLTDFTKLPPLIDALSAIDVTGEQSVTYEVSDIDGAKNKAILNATERAKREAETVLSAAGAKLGELLRSQVDMQTVTPLAAYNYQTVQTVEVSADTGRPSTPAPTAQFGAGKVKVESRVNLEFAIR